MAPASLYKATIQIRLYAPFSSTELHNAAAKAAAAASGQRRTPILYPPGSSLRNSVQDHRPGGDVPQPHQPAALQRAIRQVECWRRQQPLGVGGCHSLVCSLAFFSAASRSSFSSLSTALTYLFSLGTFSSSYFPNLARSPMASLLSCFSTLSFTL